MTDTKTYPIHPACAKWPRISDQDFKVLVEDIRANGLLSPIKLTVEGEILEGKIRYEACKQAGVEPRFETYDGDDPIGFTISHNKHRRHMTTGELALIGDELAQLQHGTNRFQKKVDAFSKASTSKEATQEDIGRQLGISRSSIQSARSLKEHAEPNIIELVQKGRVGVQNAAAYVRHTSREEQREAVPEMIKHQGNKLRSPIQNGLTTKRKNTSAKSLHFRKNRVVSFMKFSPEQLQELNEKLRPLIKRLRVQSKKHIVEFCPYELECIAFDMGQILERWADPNTGKIPQPIPDLVRPKVGNE